MNEPNNNNWTFLQADYTATDNICTLTITTHPEAWYEIEIRKLRSEILHYRSLIHRARGLLLWGL